MGVKVEFLDSNCPSLKKNDEIRIVSPSGVVKPEFVDGAKLILESWGYKATVGLNAKNSFGRYAGTDLQRLMDLQAAVDDENVKAILCSRGGYGLSRIIDKLDLNALKNSPKLVLGFSDITFLHNLWGKAGLQSIHSIMAKHLTELDVNDKSVENLKCMLRGELVTYKLASHPLNRMGRTVAPIVGGNLSIVYAARATGFEPDYRGKILFIEDIAEEAYHIDRMMQNLRLGGVLDQISGLIVGHFTDCPSDSYSGDSAYQIIRSAVDAYDFPLCFGFPVGHEEVNYPLLFGVDVEFVVE